MSNQQNEKLIEKKQKIAAAEAQISRLKAEISRQARADDTRKKILLGSFIMAAISANPSSVAMLKLNGKRLDDFLLRPADRHLFGLSATNQTTDK
ncbi:MAG: mobilization protein [Pseudomonadota bacterium]